MRFLHTADWHLGRLFHGLSLTAEQAPLLDQVVDFATETKVDAILLAGDIYDRSVPPADAVRLFDDFLNRMAGAHIPVIAITGNHDSGDRLSFGARLMRERGIYLSGRITQMNDFLRDRVILQDQHGPVYFYSIPYMEPPLARTLLGRPELRDHESCMNALLRPLRDAHPKNARSVLLAHAFVGSAPDAIQESESERPLAIGGASLIRPSTFAGFNYVALGHLHRPQSAGAEHIRYAGSLFPYSFSEADCAKSVSLVKMDAGGQCQIEKVPLFPQKCLRVIEGKLDEIICEARANPNGDHEDYLLVRLLDHGALLQPMARLREVFPNLLQIERLALEAEFSDEIAPFRRASKSPAQLFDDFFEQVMGTALDEAERKAYAEVVDTMTQQEREGFAHPTEST